MMDYAFFFSALKYGFVLVLDFTLIFFMLIYLSFGEIFPITDSIKSGENFLN